MRIDGPYGESVHEPEWTKYRTLVVIAGGIGVCPYIWHLSKSSGAITPLHVRNHT